LVYKGLHGPICLEAIVARRPVRVSRNPVTALRAALLNSPFSDFTRIYRHGSDSNGQAGFEADIAEHVKDLPDGAKIRMKITD